MAEYNGLIMSLTEYTETIGPIGFGNGGVAYYDYDLTRRANITIKSINCIWTGTTVTSQYFPASGYDPGQPYIAPTYGTAYGYTDWAYGSTAYGPNTRSCVSVPGVYSYTFVSSEYQYLKYDANGSNQYSGGSAGSPGGTVCSPYNGPNFGNPLQQCFIRVQARSRFSYQQQTSPGQQAIAPHYDNPAHTDYYYTTPTNVSIGSVVAATFTQGGYLNAGVNSNSYAITANKILPGSINRINSGAIGGNGSALFQLTIVYTLNTPVPIHYLSYKNASGITVLLPLCKLNDIQLYTSMLRVRGPKSALSACTSYNTTAYTDQTANSANATVNDVPLPPSANQINDAIYFGELVNFNGLFIVLGTAGSYTGTLAWEYWNGSAWTALSGVVDGTAGFKNAAGEYSVTWSYPTNWAQNAVNAVTKYWVRARVSACSVFSTQPKATQAHVSEILCADLIPITGNDHTDWSGVKICAPTPTSTEVLVWRKKV